MSTQDSRALDEILAYRPKKIEFGIAVAITTVIAGEIFTGQADFTHESMEHEDLDYRNMTIAWFEANCEQHNMSWNVADMMLGLALAEFPLSAIEAVATEFDFDVDYQEV